MRWSRDQSQDAGGKRAISSGIKSRATGNLQSLSEIQKRYNRRAKGIVKPFSAAIGPVETDKPKERDFLVCMRADFKPARIRGRNGCRLSDAKRAELTAHHAAREAFFASL